VRGSCKHHSGLRAGERSSIDAAHTTAKSINRERPDTVRVTSLRVRPREAANGVFPEESF